MATRQSVDNLLQQCEEAIQFAEEQNQLSSMQGSYNEDNYILALQKLEAAYNDLAKLSLSANAQQREQLHRMRLRLQQMQNHMIIQ